jgi:phage baseplate assembly protein W
MAVQTISQIGQLKLTATATSTDISSETASTDFFANNNWIDFGATGLLEVYQNVKYIILTEYFSVVLDREFGFNLTMVDKPIPIAELMFDQEAGFKIPLYEPRAIFESVSYEGDNIDGHLIPSITFGILSIDELPRQTPELFGIPDVTVASPVVSTVNVSDFVSNLIDAARQPGKDGTPGLPGVNAYTVTVTSSFVVPVVGASVVVNVADASWIVIGQLIYIDTAGGGIGLAGALQVTAKSGNTLTLLNPVPPTLITGGGGGTAVSQVFGEMPNGLINGSNRDYTSVYLYRPNQLAVFLNGIRQHRPDDYSETGGQSFSFVNAPLVGDSISIDYIQS